MTLELEQEESIKILEGLKIASIKNEAKVSIQDDEKIVVRNYNIEKNSEYPTMDRVTIRYKVNKYTEKVKDYEIYLSNNLGDVVYLVKYSPEAINTLFNNIILLEMSNWRRISRGLKPLKNIDDYPSLIFEINDSCSKQSTNILKKVIEKNTYELCKKFEKFKNTNEVIPAELWQHKLIEAL